MKPVLTAAEQWDNLGKAYAPRGHAPTCAKYVTGDWCLCGDPWWIDALERGLIRLGVALLAMAAVVIGGPILVYWLVKSWFRR